MIYLRAHSGLSTEEISTQSGVPIGTINKIFTGETKNPTGKTASKLARVFDVTAEYLLNDDIPIEQAWEQKKSTPISESGLTDPLDLQLMEFVKQLTPDQKEFLLAQIRTMRERQ